MENNFFFDGICLFCEKHAEIRHFGEYDTVRLETCECHGRLRWEEARLELERASNVAEIRLKIYLKKRELEKAKRLVSYLEDCVTSLHHNYSSKLG